MNFLMSPEFKELENSYSIVKDLGELPYKAETKEGIKELGSSSELQDYVLIVAKKASRFRDTKDLER